MQAYGRVLEGEGPAGLFRALEKTQPRVSCDCCGRHLNNHENRSYIWHFKDSQLEKGEDLRLCCNCHEISESAKRFRGLTIKTRNVSLARFLADDLFDDDEKIYEDDPDVVAERVHAFFEKAFPEFQVVITQNRHGFKHLRNLTFKRQGTLVKSAHKK